MRTHPLEVEMVPVATLIQHPDNANNGDVGAIEESIEINGFYSPLLVQRSTQRILAGNHRYLAAMRLGAAQIPAIYLDVSDEQAKRIMLSDNAITRRGFDDEGQLLNLLQDLYATDVALHGTGYDVDDMNKLMQELETPLDLGATAADPRTDPEQGPKGGMRFTVTPIVSEDGAVYEIVLEKSGMGPISKTDMQAIRKALGLAPASKSEIEAFAIPAWR